MALIPFPGPDDAELATATTALKQALSPAVGGFDDADLQRLARSVSERIEKYASGAPDSVKDEALVRAVAWLSQSLGNGPVVQEELGPRRLQFEPRIEAGWFRYSSAQSMLSPWRNRGVGIIQTED